MDGAATCTGRLVIARSAQWGVPAKANGICGERRSQDTGGIFHLQKIERCIWCFDDVAISNATPAVKRLAVTGRCGHRPLQEVSMVRAGATVRRLAAANGRYYGIEQWNGGGGAHMCAQAVEK